MTEDVKKPEVNSVIRLSLTDAANNCHRDGAVAEITMKSGVQFSGKLEKPTDTFSGTAHLKTADGGWTTIDATEIAAVGVHPGDQRRRGF